MILYTLLGDLEMDHCTCDLSKKDSPKQADSSLHLQVILCAAFLVLKTPHILGFVFNL